MNIYKKLYFMLMSFVAPSIVFGADAGIDQTIDSFFSTYFGWFVNLIFFSVEVTDGANFPLIVLWLFVAAIIFTFYFGFVQFKQFRLSLDIVSGKYSNPDKSKEHGEISHFQALSTALSGTVGLGNIAGVGVALAIGGPGATFWMVLVGILGMASKFTECTLGVKYRNEYVDENGEHKVSGGPMYYLSKGLAELGKPGLGKFLAIAFSVMTILGAFGAGNMFQGNQANAIIVQTFGLPSGYGWLTGLVLAIFVGFVIVGGIKSIAKVTEKLVPFMAIMYIIMSLIVLIGHADKIGDAFSLIINGAFTGEGVAGGFIGALIQGLKRATFSNEAGIGSAAIAHSAVKTNEPVTEGLVSLLEPLIDTVIICTMTALVITVSGLNTGELSGVELTAAAFSQTSGIFQYALTIAVVLFAVSTMISWSYYGLKAWTYLFGEGRTRELTYKLIFCLFIIVGASISFGSVIDFSDAAIFSMSIFNIIGLYFLMPIVKRELKSFVERVKSGEIVKYK